MAFNKMMLICAKCLSCLYQKAILTITTSLMLLISQTLSAVLRCEDMGLAFAGGHDFTVFEWPLKEAIAMDISGVSGCTLGALKLSHRSMLPSCCMPSVYAFGSILSALPKLFLELDSCLLALLPRRRASYLLC